MNWIPFDKDKPETWPGGVFKVMVWVESVTGRGVVFCCWRNGTKQFARVSDGEIVRAENITHYCIPTTPNEESDYVRVPKKLTVDQGYAIEQHAKTYGMGVAVVADVHAAIVNHFENGGEK